MREHVWETLSGIMFVKSERVKAFQFPHKFLLWLLKSENM